MRRALVAAVVALVALVASPASADDEIEIDERLASAGYAEAFTDYLPAPTDDGEGVHVFVDYDSDSASAEQYRDEAARAAATVWDHLEMHVLSVTVAPTTGVAWQDGDVPPPLLFSRAELARQHGSRPASLDEGGAGYFGSGGDLAFLIGALVVALVLLGGGLLGGFFWGRASGRRSAQRSTWPPYGGPPQWGGGGPGWQPAPAPGGWPPPGPPPGTPYPPHDPWRPA